MNVINEMKRRFLQRLRSIVSPLEHNSERQLILQCLLAAKMNRNLSQVRVLADVEFCGFSQWGEDGIIDWLVERLPGIPRTFVEFGVENYRESNTRLLLLLRNWRGLVMDGSAEHVSDIQRQNIYWRYDLTAKSAFIDRDNVNELISTAGFNGDIGLLSVDIDGNDYWVWQAIDVVSPVIVVCEYNAILGDLHQICVPYKADFQRNKAHHSNLYYGASLPALIDIADQKGYVFTGTNSNGCNAFFVRSDLATAVIDSIIEIKAFPSSFREGRDLSGQLSYAQGSERSKIIQHLPVFDFKTKSIRILEDLDNLYSHKWLQMN